MAGPISTGAADKSTLRSKGDLFVATGPGEVDRVPVGPDGTVLTADSTQDTGLRFAVTGDNGLNAYRVTESTNTNLLVSSALVLEADAGMSDVGNSAVMAAVLGSILDNGDALTKLHNYIAGLIGLYSVTAANASTFPKGAVLAGIGDNSTTADGAVVAFVDGDSGVTTARAAFKVMSNNSDAASGFDFGLDLQDAAHDSFAAVDEAFYLKAPVRLVSDVVELVGSGAPTDGVAGTGVDVAGPGSRYTDIAGPNLYINGNTKASPTWKLVTRAV
jgi:hypothetical protein